MLDPRDSSPHRDLSPNPSAPSESTRYSRINGRDVADALSDLLECSQVQAKAGLKLTTEAIIDLTVAAGRCGIVGVGVWRTRTRNSVTAEDSSHTPQASTGRITIRFSPSPLMTEVFTSPLSPHARHLAILDLNALPQRFQRVWAPLGEPQEIFERVHQKGKAGTQDLYQLMALRGMADERVARHFVLGLKTVMHQMLAERTSVQISGFGTFRVYDVGPSVRRNPATGESMTVPRHTKVRFVAGTDFKDTANDDR